jgi:hypothetical protein
MNDEPLPREGWTFLRWAIFAAIIFAAQLAAFFLLGRTQSVVRINSQPAPALIVQQPSQEVLDLENPTLFALANQRGFSGKAWLQVAPMKYERSDWSEPERWLELPAGELGSVLRQLIETNGSLSFVAQKVEPRNSFPRFHVFDATNKISTFHINGALAKRSLLSRSDLPSWQRPELLTNSVVEVTVNAPGFVNTATLLASSGDKKADDLAISLSKSARFEPVPLSQRKVDSPTIFSGQIIFEWQTTLSIETNSSTSLP